MLFVEHLRTKIELFSNATGAEWKYAARGGNKSQDYKYSVSDNIDDVGWYDGNSSSRINPGKTKFPNESGLYDMNGNVREWCRDWYGDYSSRSLINPTDLAGGPSSGSWR